MIREPLALTLAVTESLSAGDQTLPYTVPMATWLHVYAWELIGDGGARLTAGPPPYVTPLGGPSWAGWLDVDGAPVSGMLRGPNPPTVWEWPRYREPLALIVPPQSTLTLTASAVDVTPAAAHRGWLTVWGILNQTVLASWG